MNLHTIKTESKPNALVEVEYGSRHTLIRVLVNNETKALEKYFSQPRDASGKNGFSAIEPVASNDKDVRSKLEMRPLVVFQIASPRAEACPPPNKHVPDAL